LPRAVAHLAIEALSVGKEAARDTKKAIIAIKSDRKPTARYPYLNPSEAVDAQNKPPRFKGAEMIGGIKIRL